MRTSKSLNRNKNPNFAIVIDGETEFWYFQMLVRNERDNLNVRIKPELPSKKSLIDQFKLVKQLSEDYTKTFWIVDLDVVLKETREVKKGEKTRIQELEEYINILSKKYPETIVLIVNNPCLEFWLLLHFESTSKFFDTCASAEKQLKKHLKDYEKTEKYFTKQNNDIYLKLKPHLKNALNNAKKLGQFNIKESNSAISEMQLFFEAKEFGQLFK
ncbi:RloB family protein [Pedobacter alpinus]|uniref:RloB family protein n=1 Tax=Pedobacter alpinus TaxID=1590643 RepID=A0ABW5TQQ8_9SPHI